MSFATVASRALSALSAEAVSVEVHIAPGLPGWTVVGLPEAAVREARDRVRAAIVQCGYQVPVGRITVNLAPADLPKEGGRFDLAMALGILTASKQVPGEALAGIEVLGELSLSGALRPVRGVLPAAIRSHADGHGLLVPAANVGEAGLVRGMALHAGGSLGDICAALHAGALPVAETDTPAECSAPSPAADLRDVTGQPQARRALEIAAAGGHSLLMIGPPGSGKSMLAARLSGILPPLDEAMALEVGAIHSVAGDFDARNWGVPPYRAPHHTTSAVALAGGGPHPRPGECSLSHGGALFLDELPEWRRDAVEVLREPLETGRIRIARAACSAEFPARFQLVAAMNPCPCGYLGDTQRQCACTPDQVARYRGRVSGPVLDRIDLHVAVPRVPLAAIAAPAAAPVDDSATVRARVLQARAAQRARQECANAALDGDALQRHLRLAQPARDLLLQAVERLELSMRGFHRIQRVARSIADLDGSADTLAPHVAEAVQYRSLDRAPG